MSQLQSAVRHRNISEESEQNSSLRMDTSNVQVKTCLTCLPNSIKHTVVKYVSKGSNDNMVVCSLKRERLACFSQPRWHRICCSVLSPRWVCSLMWLGFSNTERLGLAPVLYLADFPHYSWVLPDLLWWETSNQQFYLCLQFKNNYVCILRFNLSPGRWLFRTGTWCC